MGPITLEKKIAINIIIIIGVFTKIKSKKGIIFCSDKASPTPRALLGNRVGGSHLCNGAAAIFIKRAIIITLRGEFHSAHVTFSLLYIPKIKIKDVTL